LGSGAEAEAIEVEKSRLARGKELRVALAFHSGEDAKLAEEQHLEVDDLVVAHEMGIAGIQGGAATTNGDG
jgi:hypothetical protein